MSYQRSRQISNAKFQLETEISALIPVPLTVPFTISRPVRVSNLPTLPGDIHVIETKKDGIIAYAIAYSIVGDITYYSVTSLFPKFDFLNTIQLQSVAGTWRGFPNFLSPSENVVYSNYPIQLNYSPTCTLQPFSLTADPTGFFVSLLLDSLPTTFRLFCTESDYTQGIVADGTNLVSIEYNQSHRLATSTNGQNTSWAFVPLFNKTIEWTVDLSNIPCGLNATYYSTNLTVGQQYADACATNPGATEFDFMEANQSAWHTTLHLKNNDCGSAPPIGYGGTITDPKYLFTDSATGSQQNTYGPGTQYSVNTLFPFTASITQTIVSGNLTTLTLTLTQTIVSNGTSTKRITAKFDATNEEYPGWLTAFGQEINDTSSTNGNVIFWSLWTGGLDWLESPPCPYGSSANTDPSYIYTLTDMQFFTPSN
jgi:hypothetical protein